MSNLHKHDKYILNYKKFTNIVISTVEYFFLFYLLAMIQNQKCLKLRNLLSTAKRFE